MKTKRPRPLPVDRVRSYVRAALAAAGTPFPFDPSSLAPSEEGLVRTLPSWIGRFAVLRSSDALVLWCEPRRGGEKTFPSQIILDVSPGRYFVDALDAASGRWIFRESAAGGPLVAGLPFAGGPILLLVRPFSGGR